MTKNPDFPENSSEIRFFLENSRAVTTEGPDGAHGGPMGPHGKLKSRVKVLWRGYGPHEGSCINGVACLTGSMGPTRRLQARGPMVPYGSPIVDPAMSMQGILGPPWTGDATSGFTGDT